MPNPLVSDPFIDFVLFDWLGVETLCRLPHFREHSRATIEPWLSACRRVAREVLWSTYRPMDEAPPRFEGGRVVAHPAMKACWRELVDLGVLNATRPAAVGGQQLPLTVASLSHAYLMAANLSAYGYAGLTTGAAHLIEAFGDDAVKSLFLSALYEGRWSGTMALTEPQAGSSLADLTSRAAPRSDGRFSLSGSKIFISGGDHDVTDNVVHLVLARIEGAPAGTKGISLFAVPRLRPEGGALVDNDVAVAGLIHKIGWRGLPSVALSLGERGDCIGWLVGAPHTGLKCMFQMMNEARIMVGVNGAATASVAFHEALAYARDRKQGRPLGVTDASAPPVPLVEYFDVRRMLLRQKAIVDGSLALLGLTSRFADEAEHATDEATRADAKLLLDLLTPIAKTFPAEKGFEANTLALQVHGGYGYSSEYLPEAWLRDQKLNSIHEGTTTIQGLDLLGRKVVAGQGAALLALDRRVRETVATAEANGLSWALPLSAAMVALAETTATLGARGASGDVVGMLAHSADFMELAQCVVLGWVHLSMATRVAQRRDDFAQGLLHSARYWLATEVPRATHLAHLCTSAEDSFITVRADWLG
ncbi:MAG: acyl-CoA dehydrogenase [Myxococcaceae bacterium]|nr:acyl-CoA dehydrogenase [Myxococcaceae bacterium]